MPDCNNSCKCCRRELSFKIYVPSGSKIGTVDIFGVHECGDIVSQFTPGRVRDDWCSDEEEDPDYVPSDESDIEGIYENAHLSKEEIKELEEELRDILLEQDNEEIDGSTDEEN